MQVAFYKGTKRFFNRIVSWGTNGPYSHCELVWEIDTPGEYMCGSSSGMDHGVRFKIMSLPSDTWDLVNVPWANPVNAKNWVASNIGKRYDYLGLFGFVGRRGIQDQNKYFCSEAVAAALGFPEPWRFDPNTLYTVIKIKNM